MLLKTPSSIAQNDWVHQWSQSESTSKDPTRAISELRICLLRTSSKINRTLKIKKHTLARVNVCFFIDLLPKQICLLPALSHKVAQDRVENSTVAVVFNLHLVIETTEHRDLSIIDFENHVLHRLHFITESQHGVGFLTS